MKKLTRTQLEKVVQVARAKMGQRWGSTEQRMRYIIVLQRIACQALASHNHQATRDRGRMVDGASVDHWRAIVGQRIELAMMAWHLDRAAERGVGGL